MMNCGKAEGDNAGVGARNEERTRRARWGVQGEWGWTEWTRLSVKTLERKEEMKKGKGRRSQQKGKNECILQRQGRESRKLTSLFLPLYSAFFLCVCVSVLVCVCFCWQDRQGRSPQWWILWTTYTAYWVSPNQLLPHAHTNIQNTHSFYT